MLSRNEGGGLEVDQTCDSSIWGLFAFGMYAAEDPRINATMDALRQRLWLRTETGGMARYENDGYYRISNDVPGNPWFISTLWLAEYLIRKGKEEDELKEAVGILSWVADHALPSGVLAEQLHPYSGEPLSVSPLTWSHATFVATTQRYLQRVRMKETGVSRDWMEDWIGKLFAETCDRIHGACLIR